MDVTPLVKKVHSLVGPAGSRLLVRAWVAALGIVLALSISRAQTSDDELAFERERLLTTYAAFKGYNLPPATVYQNLTPDRKAVFDASLRALFQAIEDRPAHSTGKRVIDYLAEVRGIWGVRLADKHGEHMFRLSVNWRLGIAKALRDSSNIGPSSFAHVLLPEPTGGDDDPIFTGFRFVDKGLETFRQEGLPSIQVSLVEKDEKTGEIDVDFDPLPKCHKKPANSDVGSVKDNKHQHVDLFNKRFRFFQQPLTLNWSSQRHCESVY